MWRVPKSAKKSLSFTQIFESGAYFIVLPKSYDIRDKSPGTVPITDIDQTED